MRLQTRKLLDKSFTGLSIVSVVLLTLSLVVVLGPIVKKGLSAFFFTGTVEFRRLNYEKFNRGNKEDILKQISSVTEARKQVYDMLYKFEDELDSGEIADPQKYDQDFGTLKQFIHELFGPEHGAERPVMMRDQYGKTRWDQVEETLFHILNVEIWDYSGKDGVGKKVHVKRVEQYKDTSLAPIFGYIEGNIEKMMLPEFTFYWQFLTDTSFDSHFFGGIWPEVLGTMYLVFWTMVFAIPAGVISAIYLVEFAKEGKIVSTLRVFISTLAGVPSIVFGLFGLAFFINTLKVSNSKSVIAGSLTLAILILPTIIRASEEAIKSVPKTYKEAALSLGANRLKAVVTVILPAALPGILTGIVISMGRAAGETAPIIFTAAVSVGNPLGFTETLNQPTPALSWNIYNLVTEHEAVEQIRHVQFGMVFTLVGLVLILNLAAIMLRARIAKKLRG